MNPPLRRSRRSRARPSVTYRVGDVVEIRQGTSTSQVKLLCKLTPSQASASESEQSSADVSSLDRQWLVAFVSEGGGTFGENGVELSERLFGRIVRTCGPGASISLKMRESHVLGRKGETNHDGAAKTAVESKDELCSNSVASVAVVSNESDEACSTEAEPAEVVSLADDTRPPPRGTPIVPFRLSHSTTSATLSAREERSRRRQAKIEEQQAIAAAESVITSSNEEKPRGATASRRVRKRAAPNTIDSITSTKPKASAAATRKRKKTDATPEPEEEVVKINMNTGILYLYRGLNRRAVFVRRV